MARLVLGCTIFFYSYTFSRMIVELLVQITTPASIVFMFQLAMLRVYCF
jgi:hypothetical protein